jgi:hypothetical protein
VEFFEKVTTDFQTVFVAMSSAVVDQTSESNFLRRFIDPVGRGYGSVSGSIWQNSHWNFNHRPRDGPTASNKKAWENVPSFFWRKLRKTT